MPDIQPTCIEILTENPEHSQPTFRVDTFRVAYWAHRWSGYNRTRQQQTDISRLQSARALKRHHGNGYARIGQRDRDVCDMAQQGLTDRQIANTVNSRHQWHLIPIRRRRVCAIRHQHSGCSSSYPCRLPAILETVVVDSDPHSPRAFPIDTSTVSTASLAVGGNTVDVSYWIGSATPSPRRYVRRTIPTRYGSLTYVHDLARWPLAQGDTKTKLP